MQPRSRIEQHRAVPTGISRARIPTLPYTSEATFSYPGIRAMLFYFSNSYFPEKNILFTIPPLDLARAQKHKENISSPSRMPLLNMLREVG